MSSRLALAGRALATVGGLCLVTAAFLPLSTAQAVVPDAVATVDFDCATQPSTVPAGFSCTVLDEPSGINVALHGETWWSRTGSSLRLISFALGEITEVQVCVRDTAAFDPVNVQADKCSGDQPARIHVGDPAGSMVDLTLDLSTKGIDDTETAYWVIHVNQQDGGPLTTTSQGSSGGTSPSPSPSASLSQSASPSASVSVSVSVSPSASASVAASVAATADPSGSASVLPTGLATSPTAQVSGVKFEQPGALPATGLPMLTLVGIGVALLLAGGILSAATPQPGRHAAR